MSKLNKFIFVFFSLCFAFYARPILSSDKINDETYYVQVSLENNVVIKDDAEIIITPEKLVFVPLRMIGDLVGIVSLNNNKFKVNDKTVTLSCFDKYVKCVDEQIYLESKQWILRFKVELDFDEKKLQVNIYPRDELPYLQKYYEPGVKYRELDNNEVIYDISSRRINDGITIDQNINVTNNDMPIYDTKVFGNIYNYDLKLFFNNKNLDYLSMTKLRNNEFNFLGLKASKFQLYDVDSVPVGSLAEVKRLRGIYINNYKNNQRQIFNNVIRFKKDKNWIGEIYRDNLLLEKVIASEAGDIIFKNLYNRKGINKYLIRFYGPEGQFEESEEVYNYKDSFSIGDDLRYEVFIGEEKYKNVNVVKLEKMINSNYTIGGTFFSQKKHSNTEVAFSFEHNLMFSNYNVEFITSFNQYKYLLYSDLVGHYSFGEFNFKSEYSNGYLKINQNEFNGQKLKYDATLFFSMLYNIKNRLLFSNFGTSENDKYISTLSSYNIFKLNLATEWTHKLNDNLDTVHQVLRYFIRNSIFQFEFKLNNEFNLNEVAGLWSYDFNEKYKYYISTLYGLTDRHIVYNLGFNVLTKYLKYNLSASYNNKDISYGANVFYSVLQLGREEFKVSPIPSESNSLLKIVAFEDRNYNGVFDYNDSFLSNVNFKINEVDRLYTTKSNGDVLVDGLPGYSNTLIKTDLNSIEDIFLFPLFVSKKIFIRPGMINTVYYPFQRFYSISIKNSKNKEFKLIDSHGEIINYGYINDNSYILEKVKPGSYLFYLGDDEHKVEFKFSIIDQDIDLFP